MEQPKDCIRYRIPILDKNNNPIFLVLNKQMGLYMCRFNNKLINNNIYIVIDNPSLSSKTLINDVKAWYKHVKMYSQYTVQIKTNSNNTLIVLCYTNFQGKSNTLTNNSNIILTLPNPQPIGQTVIDLTIDNSTTDIESTNEQPVLLGFTTLKKKISIPTDMLPQSMIVCNSLNKTIDEMYAVLMSQLLNFKEEITSCETNIPLLKQIGIGKINNRASNLNICIYSFKTIIHLKDKSKLYLCKDVFTEMGLIIKIVNNLNSIKFNPEQNDIMIARILANMR